MTEEQFNSKYLGEMRDLNFNLRTITTQLTAIKEILNRAISPTPLNHEDSGKEVKSDE